MEGDLNGSTGKKTAMEKNYKQTMSQGQFYTLLFHVQRRDKVLLLYFKPEDIQINKSALEEMVRM